MQVDYTSMRYSSTSVTVTKQTQVTQNTDKKSEETQPAKGKTDTVSIQQKPTAEKATGKMDVSTVDQMKLELKNQQAKFYDMVKSMLSKQGVNITLGQGAWKTVNDGNYKVDAETQAAAQQAISEDGFWGVKQTSQRLVDFAKALVGGDPSRVEEMRAAFVKGYKAAEKAWGGCLPGIAGDTYKATMKLFDEWANEGKETSDSDVPTQTESKPTQMPNTSASSSQSISITIEHSHSVSHSVSFSHADIGQLEQSGLLKDVSDPLKYQGVTLRSDWCMNEKINVTVQMNSASHTSKSDPKQDGFRHESHDDTGIYNRDGHKAHHHHGEHGKPCGKKDVTLSFIKPMSLDKNNKNSLHVKGQDIPLHEDGTVSVGMPDGTVRRARVDQHVLDQMTKN